MKNTSQITTLVVGSLQTNCYILEDKRTRTCYIIDPGDDAEYITDKIAQMALLPQGILLTHGHFDHVLAAFALQHAYSIPVMMHENDQFLLNRMQKTATHFLGISQIDPPPQISSYVREGQKIRFGDSTCEVFETPGHTPGSVAIYLPDANAVFVGDVMFAGGLVGRTDHVYSDTHALKRSIQKILQLPSQTDILSGHGEPTRVGVEKE